jgi:hypothetical protein
MCAPTTHLPNGSALHTPTKRHSRIIGCHALVKLPPRALPSTAAAAGGAGGKQDAPQWAMVMEYAGVSV